MQEGIKNMNERAGLSQQALEETLKQLTSTLDVVQARLDSLEKQAQYPARMTPCIEERRNMELACQQAISRAHKERDEMQIKAERIECSRSEVLRNNQSLISESEYLAQQLAASRADVCRLQQALKARDQQYDLLKAATDPLVKRAQAIETEKRQRERGLQLHQTSLIYSSALMHDDYKIKKQR